MDININTLEDFSLPSIIISVITLIIYKVLRLVLPQKLKNVFSLLPFVLGLIFNILYYSVLVYKKFDIYSEAVFSGIISGTLASAFSSLIDRVISGKNITLDLTFLAVENVLKDLIDAKDLEDTVTEITSIIKEEISDDKKKEKIEKVLKLKLPDKSQVALNTIILSLLKTK